jgi:hypothetical protein
LIATRHKVAVPELAKEEGAASGLTPVKSTEEETAAEGVKRWGGEAKIDGLSAGTPARKHLKPGDWICF